VHAININITAFWHVAPYMLVDRYQQYQNMGDHILEHNIFIHTTVKTSNFRSKLKLKILYCQTILQLWVQVF